MSLVKVEYLAAGYGMVEVLRNISLEISTGEVVAVLGSNGVGKTTLNNCLSGLIKPKDGKIFFEDKLIILFFQLSFIDSICSVLKIIVFKGIESKRLSFKRWAPINIFIFEGSGSKKLNEIWAFIFKSLLEK